MYRPFHFLIIITASNLCCCWTSETGFFAAGLAVGW